MAGTKRPADAEGDEGGSSSSHKLSKVESAFSFFSVMKPTDESPLPWELALYAILLILQSDAHSGKKRRADGGQQSAEDELTGMAFSESVQRWTGVGGWVGWVAWAGVVGSSPRWSLGSSATRRISTSPRRSLLAGTCRHAPRA